MIRLKKKPKQNDCLIQDGKIIDVKTVKKSDLPCGLRFKELDKTLSNPEPAPKIEITAPKMDIPTGETCTLPDLTPNLPATTQYLPCYLTDGSISDFGLFEHHLKTNLKLAKRSRQDALIEIRIWKRTLKGEITADKIKKHIANPTRSQQRIWALRKYADYRLFHGDSRLTILLAISKIEIPVQQKKDPEIMGLSELEMYREHARRLAKTGDRTGIWLGSLLLGLKPSEIEKMQYQNHGQNLVIVERKTGEMKLNAPQWMIDGLEKIPDWRRGRWMIMQGVQEYGTTPREIMVSVSHYQRNGYDNLAFPNGKRPQQRQKRELADSG